MAADGSVGATSFDVVQAGRSTAEAGADLGRRFVAALVRGDFDEMAALLHPEVQFRGLSPHKFLKTRRSDPVGGVIRAFRLWFYEGAGGAYDGDHPVELLFCTSAPFGGGGRYKLSYRIREQSREMAQQFRAEALADVPDDIDWLVEQEAYYDVIDGKIAWMIVLCGGYQPLVPVETAQGRPETAARQVVV
jgi:hypothetical protein